MQIQKIKLSNFRNFKNCEIEFSCDKDKNFTIVLGQNTFGKTTLVKAFVWCLYRINLFENKILLNSEVAALAKAPEACCVEIRLTHKDCSYIIKTREVYSRSPSGNLSVSQKASTSVMRLDGANWTPVPSNRVEEEIDGILRSDLKEYFFFDGESNSIDSITSKKNLTGAVSNILGLTKIELLKEYFDPNKADSVPVRLKRELTLDDEGDLDDLMGRRDELAAQKEQFERQKQEITNEIETLSHQKASQESVLDANRDVEHYQNEKRRLESDIAKNKNAKEQGMSSLIQMINSKDAYLRVLFRCAYSKFDIAKVKEQSSFKSGESYVGITEAAVDQLIKNGKCLCGCEIKTGNDAYNHLVAAREHMEPHDYGKYIEDFDSGEASNVYPATSTLRNIDEEAKTVLDLIQQIDADEDSLKVVKERIQGRVDTGEIQKDINRIERQIGQKEAELRFLVASKIPEVDEKLSVINNKIDKSAVTSKKNDYINLCLGYADRIYRLAQYKMVKSRVEIKEQLQKEVSRIFKSMYHGNRDIKINDDFRAETYVISAGMDQKIDGSTGLGTVMNYSFVAGLMNLAKKAIINSDPEDETSDPETVNETFPLVMDAPFSNTDETHIKNICNALPNYCDQIIMFVMEKDFNYASESIADKIGKKYEIRQISETESVVEEVQ